MAKKVSVVTFRFNRRPTWQGIKYRTSWKGIKNAAATQRDRVGHRVRSSRQGGVHQFNHTTRENRYPQVFEAVAGSLSSENPKILSFGCSTGEETAALAHLMPNACIVGADVSESVLLEARSRCAALPNVSFVMSTKEGLDAHGLFDAIFAMSVLCRHPDTAKVRNCTGLYPFQQFDEAIGGLAALLRPGGLLAIYNSNYRFTDSSHSIQFEVFDSKTIGESGFVAKFDPDGTRSYDQTYPHCVFRKKVDH